MPRQLVYGMDIAEALPGLPKCETNVGANMTSRTTARRQITPKPGALPNARMCVQQTYISNNTISIGSKLTNAQQTNEQCKNRCRLSSLF
eukprot:10410446-Ditylum_brightwellii.AAC.1